MADIGQQNINILGTISAGGGLPTLRLTPYAAANRPDPFVNVRAVIWNTDASRIEVSDGSSWVGISGGVPVIQAASFGDFPDPTTVSGALYEAVDPFHLIWYSDGFQWLLQTPFGQTPVEIGTTNDIGPDDSTFARAGHVHALTQLNYDGIGVSNVQGLRLRNRASAAAGAQQASPALELEGAGWSTQGGGISENVRVQLRLVPVQSDGDALVQLVVSGSVNGAAFIDLIAIGQGEFGRRIIAPIGGSGLTFQSSPDGSGPTLTVSSSGFALNDLIANLDLPADGTIRVIGGVVRSAVGTATDYVLLATDGYVGVTDTSSVRTLTLPQLGTAFAIDGIEFQFKDESGAAATHPIVIARNGSTIDGLSSDTSINTNYGSKTLRYRNGGWWTVAKV